MNIVITVAWTQAAIWTTQLISPQAAGSGIPEVRVTLTGAYNHQDLSVRTLISRAVGVILGMWLVAGVHFSFCAILTIFCLPTPHLKYSVIAPFPHAVVSLRLFPLVSHLSPCRCLSFSCAQAKACPSYTCDCILVARMHSRTSCYLKSALMPPRLLEVL